MPNDFKMDFQTLKRAKLAWRNKTILSLCRDRNVLDVGCVGQDYKAGTTSWLHGKLQDVCHTLDGVDTNTTGVNALRQKGLSIYKPDELLATDKQYDLILMADVIEHVDAAGPFLEMYKPLLAQDGILVVTTPNAHRALNFLTIAFRGNYWLNSEHTCWYCPLTLNQILLRTGFTPKAFQWVIYEAPSNSKRNLPSRLAVKLARLLFHLRHLYAEGFLIISELTD